MATIIGTFFKTIKRIILAKIDEELEEYDPQEIIRESKMSRIQDAVMQRNQLRDSHYKRKDLPIVIGPPNPYTKQINDVYAEFMKVRERVRAQEQQKPALRRIKE